MKKSIVLYAALFFCAIFFASCNDDSKDEPNVEPAEEQVKNNVYSGTIKLNGEVMTLNGKEVTNSQVEYVKDATNAGIDTLKLHEVLFSPKQPFALQIVRLAVKADKDGNISQIEEEQAADYLFNGEWTKYEMHKFTQTKGKIDDKALTFDTYCGTVNITFSGTIQNQTQE